MRTLNQACKTYKFICTCTCAYTVKLVEVSRFMKLEKRDKLSKEVLVSIPHCLGYAIEHWNSYMWLHRTRFSVRRHQLLSLAAQRGRGGGWDEVSPLSGPATPAWATCLKFIQYFLFFSRSSWTELPKAALRSTVMQTNQHNASKQPRWISRFTSASYCSTGIPKWYSFLRLAQCCSLLLLGFAVLWSYSHSGDDL